MSISQSQKITRLALTPNGIGKKFYDDYQWNYGIKGRLPQHYKQFYQEWSKGPQIPIHYESKSGRYEKDKFGIVRRVQNVNIPVIYPDEFHLGLWGGEGVIKGLEAPAEQRHYPNLRTPQCRYWWPKLYKGVVYSEILNKYIEMTMTLRGRRLVDQHGGFDEYLLTTPVNEIYSWTLLRIKREILLRLTNPSLTDEIVDKYGQFIVDTDVADWHGLKLEEALHKQRILDRIERENNIKPRKHEYRREIVDMLKRGYLDDVDTEILAQEGEKRGIIGSTFTSIWKKTFN